MNRTGERKIATRNQVNAAQRENVVLGEIEKNIPIPGRGGRYSALKLKLMKMEVGDSFLIKCQYKRKLHSQIGQAALFVKGKVGGEFTSRRCAEGIRIWRKT